MQLIRYWTGLALLLAIILFVPRNGMVLNAVLMLSAMTALMVQRRSQPGAMLGLGLGAAVAFALFALAWLITPVDNLPGLYISLIGFATLSLVCGWFCARGMRRLQRQLWSVVR